MGRLPMLTRFRLWLRPIAGGDAGTEGTVGLDEPAVIDKRLDTRTHIQTISTLLVHREAMVIADATTDERIADVTNATPTGAMDGLVTRTLLQASGSSVTTVASSAVNVTLLSANANRKGGTVVNDSTAADLYVKFGAVASTASYTYFLPRGVNGQLSQLEIPAPSWDGIVDGIWSSASGNARLTELT